MGVLGLILFSIFRFALSGCFTELFTLRDVIESYHTDEEVAVPPECNVSRVFPCLRSCSSSFTDVVRSNEVVIMVLRGRGYCMVNIGECILLDV